MMERFEPHDLNKDEQVLHAMLLGLIHDSMDKVGPYQMMAILANMLGGIIAGSSGTIDKEISDLIAMNLIQGFNVMKREIEKRNADDQASRH